MIWGRKNRRIAELVARVEQLVEQRDEARRDAAAVRGAAVRVAGRNTHLTERNERLTEAEQQHDADLDAMAARLDRALRACARYRVEQTHRANLLQARLDDALDLNSPRVADGRHWQATREDHRFEATK